MIKFNDYGLLYPSCGGNYLHHDGVVVFNRVEDGEVTTVTTVDGGETTVCQVPSERTSNPSSRRHGIAIRFWCELCAARQSWPSRSTKVARRANGEIYRNLPRLTARAEIGKSTAREGSKMDNATSRATRTPTQVREQQQRDADRDREKQRASLPAATTGNGGTAVAIPDNRTAVQAYLDEVAPASIVGRLIKFNKDGRFATKDDDAPIGEDVDFIALVDQTLIGWIKFNGEGQPPDRKMGLLYDGFTMPPRSSLGDADDTTWEEGLDGKPSDPWQHHVYLVLQRGDTGELFTFATASITGRRAAGNLLRHYNRLQTTHPNTYPIVRLKTGGFQHRDDRVGWVSVPVLAVVGRAPKDTAAKPDSSLKSDLEDDIPFTL
jgi:hypothetical protein